MMMPVPEAISVAIGGAIGALSRFVMQRFSTAWLPAGFPSTIIVNLSGCLAIGIVWALLNHTGAPVWLQRLVITGFLGGYTTFSSFALDFVTLTGSGKWLTALAYATLSMAGGMALCWAGMKGTTALLALTAD